MGARAEEMVVGGLMAIVLVCLPDDVPPSRCTTCGINDLLEAALLDMVREVSSDQILIIKHSSKIHEINLSAINKLLIHHTNEFI